MALEGNNHTPDMDGKLMNIIDFSRWKSKYNYLILVRKLYQGTPIRNF